MKTQEAFLTKFKKVLLDHFTIFKSWPACGPSSTRIRWPCQQKTFQFLQPSGVTSPQISEIQCQSRQRISFSNWERNHVWLLSRFFVSFFLFPFGRRRRLFFVDRHHVNYFFLLFLWRESFFIVVWKFRHKNCVKLCIE